MKKTYLIEGMHCKSCIEKITSALSGLAKKVEVILDPPSAILESEIIPNIDELNAAVSKVGNYKLKIEEGESVLSTQTSQTFLRTYYPLLLIITIISIVSLKGETFHEWMLNFMAGFFLVFGAFKLLDIKGFRDAYSTYDLLAKRWHNYGLVYPFLEVALGFAFLFHFELKITLWFSIVLMSFNSLGVIEALSNKRKIRCACLGTVLNLPMSTITLVEDLSMIVMSAIMLFV